MQAIGLVDFSRANCELWSMEREVRRKRRPASACPNPLFVKWVEEWRDQAREEGSKVQYAYTKALNSLKKYPLPLVSGQEAKILDHIGEKLAKKLDKKLLEHRANENGEGSPCTTTTRKKPKLDNPHSIVDEDECDINTTKKGNKKRSPQVEYVPGYRSGPYALILALHLAQQKPNWIGYLTKTQLISQAQPYSDKSFTIPDDGGYYTAWSSMATLIRKGLVDKWSCPAKYCLTDAGEDMAVKLLRASASLTATPMSPTTPTAARGCSSQEKPPMSRSLSSPSSNRPTAPRKGPVHHSVQWSQSQANSSDDDMDTIAGSKSGSYHSTVPTSTVHTSRASSSSPERPVLLSPSAGASAPITLSDSDDSSDVEILPLASRIAGSTTTGRGRPTTPLVKGSQQWSVAETPLGGRGGNNTGTKRKEEERKESLTPSNKMVKTGSMTPAQMAGQAALHRLQKSGHRTKESHHNSVEFQSVDLTVDEEKTRHCTVTRWSSRKEQDQDEFPEFVISKPQSAPPLPQAPSVPATVSLHSTSARPSSLSHTTTSTCRQDALRDYSNTRPTTKQSPSISHTVTQPNTKAASADLGRPLFVLKPGEFDVVLCVDNAESTASRKSSSQFRGILLQELSKNGVVFDVRKLNVGDFLWVAREKTTPLPGQLTLPKSREAVLEYIVERKRMDDLAGSIIDGRFREQKFRLKHCGVRYPMYLVEEFKDALHLKLPLRSLEQAISNVQVIDEFAVHRTTDIRESVAYLTLLTRQLQHHYTDKTIEAFQWDTMCSEVKSDSSRAAISRKTTTLAVEFISFNEASVKNKTLTAYEMFGRHLMQIPGVSAERAAAILDHYPTVTALRDAYKLCSSSSEREAVISKLNVGHNRKLGKSIGKIMCDLYWRQ